MNFLSGISISSVNEEVLGILLARPECRSQVVQDFWRVLMACFNTPRPSTDFDECRREERNNQFRMLMRTMCINMGLTYSEDGVGNIIVSNFTGNQKAQYCFQGHMDVVVSKNETVVHDFEIEGVDVCITAVDTLKAIKGITLGADNGVAIACGMSVLANNASRPLELLITKNEETTFEGALGFDPNTVTADCIVNLDSEVENQICVGSAGGFAQYFHLPVERVSHEGQIFRLKIKELKGGHSGCDIDKEKGNAILAMSRTLLVDGIRIVSIDGGSSTNAIPRECSAIISCDKQLTREIELKFNEFKTEYFDSEPSVSLQVEEASILTTEILLPLSRDHTRKLLALIFSIANGVLKRRFPSGGDVESSCNLGMISTNESFITLRLLARSTSLSWMKSFAKQLTAIGESAGTRVEEFVAPFGAWEPRFDSNIVQKLKQSCPIKDRPITLYTVHAGLECSTILEKFSQVGRANVECASIGPQIEHAHSPDECLYIQSAVNFVRWIDNLVNLRV